MKTTILTLFTCLAVSTTFAIDTASVIGALGSDDYNARQTARVELKQALADASAPGADAAPLKAIEEAVIAGIHSDLPLASRLYLVRMLEWFGTPAAVHTLTGLLDSSEKELRDSARRALAAIPGETATKALVEALAKGSAADQVARVDALAYRGIEGAATRISERLKSTDPAVVSSAALALGKLGYSASIPALSSARKTAPAEAVLTIETALLDIGVDADTAVALIETGCNAAVRGGAFQQLLALDAARASTVLNSVLAASDTPGRATALRDVVATGPDAVVKPLVDSLADLDLADQCTVVSAIGVRGLSAYESQVLSLYPSTNAILQVAIIDALASIGGDASFDTLYQAFLADPRNQRTAHALARLKAPSADKKALAAATRSVKPEEQIAAMRTLELRNSPGATELLNTIAAESDNADVRKAAFESLESIGNLDSVKLFVDVILQKSELTRPAQLSLKRLSLNFGAADFFWETIYKPALAAAADDSAREALVLVLDSNDAKGTLNYLKDQVVNPESGLHDAALRTLGRWPSLSAGDTWIEIANSDGLSELDLTAAKNGIKRLLTSSQVGGKTQDKLQLAVRAIEKAPSAEYKTFVLSCYETLNNDQKKHIKKSFKPLLEDTDVGELVKQILSF